MAASATAAPLDALLVGVSTLAGVSRRGPRTRIETSLRSNIEPEDAYRLNRYPNRDPRADALVGLIEAAASPEGWSKVEFALADSRPPSPELAIAALSVACEMAPTAAEAIYLLSRTAGILAHIGEEYENPSRIQLRAVYRGVAPGETVARV
jgi:citrate synthase